MVRAPATPFLLLGVTLFFWGTGYRGTAIGAHHAPALVFAALRMAPTLVAGPVLLVLLRSRVPRGRQAAISAANGLLMVTVFVGALSEGVVRAGAGNASVLVSTSPLFVALISRPLFGELLPGRRIVGLLLGFAGVVVMFSSELHVGGGDVAVGMAIAVLAGLAWAVGTIVVKTATPMTDPVVVAGLQYVVGGPALIAIAFALEGSGGTDWSAPGLWGAVVYVGIGGMLGTFAFFAALRFLSATRTTTVQFVVPAVAVLVEVARGNVPTAVTFVGMALAVMGVGLVNIPVRNRSDSVTEPVLRRS